MKKIFIFFVLVVICNLVFSQSQNPQKAGKTIHNNYYYDINQDLKEALVLHMLILKGNKNEIKEFLFEYNYVRDFSEKHTLYYKDKNISGNRGISCAILVPLDFEDYIHSRLLVVYGDENGNSLDYNTAVDLNNALIESVKPQCPEGYACYGSLFHLIDKTYDVVVVDPGFTNVKKTKYTLEYTFKKTNKKSFYKVSNFMYFDELGILFSGPVNNAISIKLHLTEDGGFSFSIESGHAEGNEYTKQFNYKEFMSFEYLDDKIWQELK